MPIVARCCDSLTIVLAFVLTATSAVAASSPETFAEEIYPALVEAQCAFCHNDNGVGSATRLAFPAEGAGRDAVVAFGLRLRPLALGGEASKLYRKPTNRDPHTGGERIKTGSETEATWRAWVAYLAALDEDDWRASLALYAREAPTSGAAMIMRRLTHEQYNNTVRDLLGDFTRPADQFPEEDYVHGFKNQARAQSVPPLLAEAYTAAAEKLAVNAFRGGDFNHLIPCEPKSSRDTACRDAFLRQFGRRVFRRPLSARELERYGALFDAQAQANGTFLDGAQITVEAMLQSPQFLFLMEYPLGHEMGGWSAASKLAYTFWNTAPDEQLLDSAASGRLDTVAGIEAAARRLLDSPKAQPALREFVGQWMRYDRVLSTIRSRRHYPEFNDELAGAMIEETSRLFDHLVWNNENFMEFFTADYSFVSSGLAALYEVDTPEAEFGRVGFPADSGRAGVTGQATFLTLTSKPDDTSPTERGLFVREHFLCQQVPPPPPGLNTTLPPVTDAKPLNNRGRMSEHTTNPACVSCHNLVDPIGFGLEKYDAIGRFRESHALTIYPTRDEQKRKLKTKPTHYDLPIDTAAWVQGIAESDFRTPKELGTVLASDAGCQRCVVKQFFRYATGRFEEEGDQRSIDRAFAAFRDSGFRFRELAVSIVTSDSFLGSSQR